MQDVFMPLELPAKVHAPPEADEYHTLGQFYAAITLGFEKLAGPDLWKHNRADLQYQDTYWNNDGGGSPVQVTDLPSALEAIETIVEQGEGSDPDNAEVPISFDDPQPGLVELSHYAKFSAIAAGVDEIGDVWPVVENPRAHQFEQPVRALAELFNAAYCYVLCMIDSMYETPRVLDGPTSKRYGLERSFVSAMGGLLYPLGDLLVRQPLGDGKHAAPTFEFYEFDPARDKKEQLTALCHDAARTYPQLGGDDGVQRLIGLLPAV
jgi:hypothetical protein